MIGGQSTCARELLEQVDGLDAIIAPIRGGGTVSGTCLVIRRPGVDVYAADAVMGPIRFLDRFDLKHVERLSVVALGTQHVPAGFCQSAPPIPCKE